MQTKYFYISTMGATASSWLANLLNAYPTVLAIHGARSVPPFQSGTGDQLPGEFFNKLPSYRDIRKPGAKIIGGIHGYYGLTAKAEVEKRGGIFISIIRDPIKRIHSLFSHNFNNYLGNCTAYPSDMSVYDIIKNDCLDFIPDRFDYKCDSFLKRIKPALSKTITKIKNRPYASLPSAYMIDGARIAFTPVEQMFMGLCKGIFRDDLIHMHSLGNDDIYKMEEMVSDMDVCIKLLQKISGNSLFSHEQDIESLNRHFSTKIGAHSKVSYSIEDTYSHWPDSFKFIYQTILKSLGGNKLVEKYKKRFDYELIPFSDSQFHIANGRVEQLKIASSSI